MKNNRAFTLIELLVVVLIVGILAAVALPQYTKAVERSRATEAWTAVSSLMKAQRVYRLGAGKYTQEVGALDIFYQPGANGSAFSTNDFDISLSCSADCEAVTFTAVRTNGAYQNNGFSYTLNADGSITGPTQVGSNERAWTAFSHGLEWNVSSNDEPSQASNAQAACVADPDCVWNDGDCICAP